MNIKKSRCLSGLEIPKVYFRKGGASLQKREGFFSKRGGLKKNAQNFYTFRSSCYSDVRAGGDRDSGFHSTAGEGT